MFSTRTKVIDREPQGIERLQAAREISSKPLVAIGGINIDNIEMVMACSPDAICVTGAVGLAENPEKAARALSKCIEV
jgi:Thiamine monophosphate synthase